MDKRRYQVVASFDTETSNCGDIASGYFAFPCLYQFAELECYITDLKPENANNVVKVSTFRDHETLYDHLDNFILKASGYIPVVLVHNLGFDMYSLAPWLNDKDVRVLAKTAQKPISIQVLNDEGKPVLVFLDTLGLFMKSLKVMGEECGMPKAVGDWDYTRVRTLKTPLTENELHYAKQDTITLLCYMAYFLRQNPDINPDDIGFRVQTKTGIVRAKRLKHLGQLRGNGKTTVRQFWHLHNKDQIPKTDDELFTMHASTRGGFTFCARNNASRIYHASDDMRISSYDSTSQHPAQMASHLYPQRFSEATQEQLQIAFDTCGHVTTDRILRHWAKPFPFAFYAAFEFENLRLKADSLFEHEGIAPLASARVGGAFPIFDNESNSTFRDSMGELGYRDSAVDMHCAFGKLEAASKAILFLTELDAWIVHQCYDFDSCDAVSGYLSTTFRKPSDLSLLSVMRFYKAKDALKWFMESYQEGKPNDATCLKGLYPDSFVKSCEAGKAEYGELREYYMLSKADLNSLFGIEATNECRRDFELTQDGLALTGTDGLHNMPATPKCSYQYGQRIVGWSRVAQVVIMQLVWQHVDAIICGDTDSLKMYYRAENEGAMLEALERHARAVDKAKAQVCRRVRLAYPEHYSTLDGIGHYVFDGSYDAFSASWNKAYIGMHGSKCHVTLAGIPNRRSPGKHDSLNDFCDDLINQGYSFDEVASLVLGYNVTFDYSVLKLNGRIHPKWGDMVNAYVTDYLGKRCKVKAPAALALFALPKTIGDTNTKENAINCEYAKNNNPSINTSPVMLKWHEGKATVER